MTKNAKGAGDAGIAEKATPVATIVLGLNGAQINFAGKRARFEAFVVSGETSQEDLLCIMELGPIGRYDEPNILILLTRAQWEKVRTVSEDSLLFGQPSSRFLVKVDGKEKFMLLQEAAAAYCLGSARTTMLDDVLERDGTVRKITLDERRLIQRAVDEHRRAQERK